MKQEWWMPLSDQEDYNLGFMCDNLGDAQETMEAMWKEICRLCPELPKHGFPDNDNL